MTAVLGGLAAACVWAVTLLCSTRATRLIGPYSVVAWVMLVGLVVTLPAAVAAGLPDLDGRSIALLLVAGCGNVLGLLLVYSALRTGKVGIVGPIVSTEGAIAAVLAVVAGESVAAGTGATLALIVLGIVLAGIDRETEAEAAVPRRLLADSTALAVVAAFCFGASIYATGRVSEDVPIAWAVLPPRVIGVVAVAIPLLVTSRIALTRPAVPFVVAAGICEVAGFALFALGARHGIAVTAVLASQFAGIAAVAAYVLFGERLTRVQVAGAVAIATGVALITWLQA
ncbi:MAG TPA: DMT family transporter [Gaiellaceae bacterium]